MRQAEIARLLPEVFQRATLPGSPLAAFLAAVEEVQAPAESVLDRLGETFDPRQTEERFLPVLAHWLDLDRLLVDDPDEPVPAVPSPWPSGPGQLRELIASAWHLSTWRGTARGLLDFLTAATGVPGFEIEERVLDGAGNVRPFHIRVRVPEAARPYARLVERIVRSEKPAYVTYELELGQPPRGSGS
jgi:phage tail-like protein